MDYTCDTKSENAGSEVQNEKFSLLTKTRNNKPIFSEIDLKGDALLERIKIQQEIDQEDRNDIKKATLAALARQEKEQEALDEIEARQQIQGKSKKQKKQERRMETVNSQQIRAQHNFMPAANEKVELSADGDQLRFDKHGNYRHTHGVPQNLNDIFGSEKDTKRK